MCEWGGEEVRERGMACEGVGGGEEVQERGGAFVLSSTCTEKLIPIRTNYILTALD